MRARSQPNYCMNGGRRKRGIERIAGRMFAAFLAVMAGGVNALFGGGGGLLVVPALETALGVDERRAHASAVATMLPLSVCSAIVLSLRGMGDWRLALPLTVGTAFGGAIGAMALKKISTEWLSVCFYGVMIYAGIRYLG